MKTKKKSSLKFSLIFCPKLGEDYKKKRSSLKFSPIFRLKLGENQKKKKKVFTRIYSSFLSAGQKQRSLPTICMLKAFAQLTKGGGHFAILHTYLGKLYYPGDPKGGPWPNAPS